MPELTPSDLYRDLSPNWHIAVVSPGAELSLARDLTRRAFRAYCPIEVRTLIRRGDRTEVQRPLIAGYVFVASYAFASILSLPGCRELLRASSGEPAALPEAAIDYVRRLEAGREETRLQAIARRAQRAHDFAAGQRIRVAAGPFAGQSGPIERLDGRIHIRVLLDMFGRPTPVVARADEIKAA